ncbi:ANR family transcriptional regulator [Limnobaculum zhutongyuii]|uniref:ANR family transcriptional regulator n=1 Tax=Limnobaculum zhutongyuii TaxID=2498113 RepID=A0A411WIG7_9GAMM|nr:ANR family transcriptional regulator [Limnobaculum zhutongyuii]QBH95970.1 ANR family transcriptional regulator [Limnobaculum zhutongyuii]TQS89320.1 ANR family transcriptional regulator [Limnobaculum zhutongyuii]
MVENLSKTESLRQSLRIFGESTGYELFQYTGIPVDCVASLLQYDVAQGLIVKGWKGKRRSYQLALGSPKKVKKYHRDPASYRNAVPVLVESIERRFIYIAVQATELEKNDDFFEAIKLWMKAAGLAALDINADYCRRRANYCQAAVDRGWSNLNNGGTA